MRHRSDDTWSFDRHGRSTIEPRSVQTLWEVTVTTIRTATARTTAVVSSAAVLIALMVVPAVADRYEESDPAGDMAVQSDRTGEISTFSAHRNLDIRHVTVRHTQHFVLIRAVTRALTRPRAEEGFALFGFIKVNDARRPRRVRPGPGRPGSTRTYPGKAAVCSSSMPNTRSSSAATGSGDKGLEARVNYDRDRVTMIIPRRCLALQGLRVRPAWVQVFVTAAHGGRRFYYDHLGAPARVVLGGQFNSGYNRWLTPRLYPG